MICHAQKPGDRHQNQACCTFQTKVMIEGVSNPILPCLIQAKTLTCLTVSQPIVSSFCELKVFKKYPTGTVNKTPTAILCNFILVSTQCESTVCYQIVEKCRNIGSGPYFSDAQLLGETCFKLIQIFTSDSSCPCTASLNSTFWTLFHKIPYQNGMQFIGNNMISQTPSTQHILSVPKLNGINRK